MRRRLTLARFVGSVALGLVALWTVWLVVGLFPIASSAIKAQAAASALILDRNSQSEDILSADLAQLVQSVEDLRRACDSPQWRFLALLPGIGPIPTQVSEITTNLSDGLTLLDPYVSASSGDWTADVVLLESSTSQLKTASLKLREVGDGAMKLAARTSLRPFAASLRSLSRGATALGVEVDELRKRNSVRAIRP